jgi:DNA-binding NarL/FixJ family response regulator
MRTGEGHRSAEVKLERPTTTEDSGAREALRRAALEIDRASGRLARTAPRAAIELWKALVAGRWTLIDSFKGEGRWYLLAQRNPRNSRAPRTPRRALTERERQVVGHAALGRSNKLIAYELGLAPSTVATHLAEAARKLRVRSRSALIRAWSAALST